MKRIHESYLFSPEINFGKMIFLFGPRQIGKTTLIQNYLRRHHLNQFYFNWDDPKTMALYRENPRFLDAIVSKRKRKTPPLVAFDEIHKQRNWKNILKGIYDTSLERLQLFVTGSARLDYFRRSGDSLIGRYFSFRMLPIGVAEAAQKTIQVVTDDGMLSSPDKNHLLSTVLSLDEKPFFNAFSRLFKFGGFPEPFLRGSTRFSQRWKEEYQTLLLREDLRDLTRIQHLRELEELAYLLPKWIGNRLQIKTVADKMNIRHETAYNWLDALMKVYLIFSIPPWIAGAKRSIKKARKYYFYDWTLNTNPSAQFENFVAVTLLGFTSRMTEFGLGQFKICYIEDRNKREVDFVIIKDRHPIFLVEAKSGETKISKTGRFYSAQFKIPLYQISASGDGDDYFGKQIYRLSAWRFLSLLG